MSWRLTLVALLVISTPARAGAADVADLNLPVWSVTPFVVLLLAIAFMPLVAGHWWHHNRSKAIVATALALPMVGLFTFLQFLQGQPTLSVLAHELVKYASFIALLGALYIVSGGLVVHCHYRPRPAVNVAFLAVGACVANLIGTTGASALLIRPFLRINRHRKHSAHLPVFFIFSVSNLGGLLTPLGDPPLFLGFLHGVPFFWTLSLWPQWLVTNGLVLGAFLVWDVLVYREETPATEHVDHLHGRRLWIEGRINFAFLAGIMGMVLLQGELIEPWNEVVGILSMAVLACLSLRLTPGRLRTLNDFSWEPILEVAILFAGIFITMIPALTLLAQHGKNLGIDQPWEYFWLTGALSSFLDNAPTYLTFAIMAAGSEDVQILTANLVPGLDGPRILQAISCGAVFMGAMTYIGNGPNFLVKAISDKSGMRTPGFLGYCAYSAIILLPIFAIVTLMFF
ncbi:MAG: sodium:proton antiporter [Planctomycetes bacterium]|nr:sodium:proton antiporter [Planctomycetota bacterium]